MATFEVRTNQTVLAAGEESGGHTVLVDEVTRVGWLREAAEKHYAGTFGRESPVYGRNPHGAAWYRLRFDPAIATESDYSDYRARGRGVLVCSGAWRHAEGTYPAGVYVKVTRGPLFGLLEAAWRRHTAGAAR